MGKFETVYLILRRCVFLESVVGSPAILETVSVAFTRGATVALAAAMVAGVVDGATVVVM